MKKRILQYLYLLLFFSVVGLTSIGIVVYLSIHRMNRQGELLTHTQNVLFQTEQVVSILKDAETGQRGFLVTHEPSFLQPYFVAIDSIQPCLDQLKILVNNNSLQTARVDSLQILVSKRFVILNDVLITQVRKNTDILKNKMDYGKAIMDQIRALIAEIKLVEQANYKAGVKNFATVSTQTLHWLGLLFAGSVFLFVGAFYFILRELQQRWHYQSELEKTIEKLSASNAELEHFTFISSHHLQEPVRKLQTFADRLRSKYGAVLEEDARYLVRRMGDTAEQMHTLIHDLLTYIQLGKVQFHGDFQRIDLKAIVQHLVENEFAHQVEELGARVELKGNGPFIRGEMQQIQDLFAHLIQNSLKFGRPDRNVILKFEFGLAENNDLARISNVKKRTEWAKVLISDNGIGFDPQYNERIFQLFSRLDNKPENIGTGVGLAICKKVMQNHQGYIFADSDPDGGARFELFFPVNLNHLAM